MKELLEAGVHFGHQTRRWNPKMKGVHFRRTQWHPHYRSSETSKCFREASRFVSELAGQGRAVLFVGTKRQAQEAVAESRSAAVHFFVNHRWLGGTLTNWATLQKIHQAAEAAEGHERRRRIKELSKKEQARLDRE